MMNPQYRFLLEQLGIDVDNLKRHFNDQSIYQGIACYINGKVLDIEEVYENDRGGLSVNGLVSGSRRQVYDTGINLTQHNNGLLSVDAECSCPVGLNCKHGIALLFDFITTLQQNRSELFLNPDSPATEEAARATAEEQQVNAWLTAIAENEHSTDLPARLADQEAKQKAQYHLVYVLDFTSSARGEQRCTITPLKVRQLKKGGYGKPIRFNSYDIRQAYHPANFYYDTVDEEIFRALETFESPYYYDRTQYYLEGEISAFTLHNILRTGRCFWKTQEKNEPLTPGPDNEIRLDWVEHDDYVTINPVFSLPVSHLFQVGQFHYTDKSQRQCGLVTHPDLTTEQLVYFLNAPPIPKPQARTVSEQLLRLFPDREVPLPEPLDIEERVIEDTTPVIRLRLHGEMIPHNQRIHIASLSFDYGDIVIQPHTEDDYQQSHTVRIEGQKRFHIDRDRSSEDLARKVMLEAGFTSLDPEKSPFGILDMAIYIVTDLSESIAKWDSFMQNRLPELREAGWQVTIEDSFYLSVTTVDDWQAELESDESGEWFELALGFELDGQRINLLPILVELLATSTDTAELRRELQAEAYRLVRIADYQWVKLPTQRLLRVLDTLLELYDTDTLNSAGNLEFSRHEGMHYGDLLNDAGLQWKGAEELKALHERLQQFNGIEPSPLPENLQASLRDYQQHGYDWLAFMRDYGFNGVLADDMGLGKTVQALSLLLAEQESGRAQYPNLVIAPTSLMSNWYNEAARFTPDLKVLVLQGNDRKQKFEQCEQADIVVTTYPLIVRDSEFYQDKQFHYLILDEAQAIKNPRAKSSQTISQLKSQHRLCLTGTPVENHLGELWS